MSDQNRITFFDELEQLNNSDSTENLGELQWVGVYPSVATVVPILKENAAKGAIKGYSLVVEKEEDAGKFQIGEIAVVTCDVQDKAIAGNKLSQLAKITQINGNTILVANDLSAFPKRVQVYSLVWWAVPYPDDLVEMQSRQLAALEEKEQSLALKLSSPEVSRKASVITKKIQTGEIDKEAAQAELGELALSSGNISAESLAEFNQQTYQIKIQKAEIYMGMPRGHLSILDSLKGLPKQRLLKEFDELQSPEPQDVIDSDKKKEEVSLI